MTHFDAASVPCLTLRVLPGYRANATWHDPGLTPYIFDDLSLPPPPPPPSLSPSLSPSLPPSLPLSLSLSLSLSLCSPIIPFPFPTRERISRRHPTGRPDFIFKIYPVMLNGTDSILFLRRLLVLWEARACRGSQRTSSHGGRVLASAVDTTAGGQPAQAAEDLARPHCLMNEQRLAQPLRCCSARMGLRR